MAEATPLRPMGGYRTFAPVYLSMYARSLWLSSFLSVCPAGVRGWM